MKMWMCLSDAMTKTLRRSSVIGHRWIELANWTIMNSWLERRCTHSIRFRIALDEFMHLPLSEFPPFFRCFFAQLSRHAAAGFSVLFLHILNLTCQRPEGMHSFLHLIMWWLTIEAKRNSKTLCKSCFEWNEDCQRCKRWLRRENENLFFCFFVFFSHVSNFARGIFPFFSSLFSTHGNFDSILFPFFTRNSLNWFAFSLGSFGCR